MQGWRALCFFSCEHDVIGFRLSLPAQLHCYVLERASLGMRLPGNNASDKWQVYIALVLGMRLNTITVGVIGKPMC